MSWSLREASFLQELLLFVLSERCLACRIPYFSQKSMKFNAILTCKFKNLMIFHQILSIFTHLLNSGKTPEVEFFFDCFSVNFNINFWLFCPKGSILASCEIVEKGWKKLDFKKTLLFVSDYYLLAFFSICQERMDTSGGIIPINPPFPINPPPCFPEPDSGDIQIWPRSGPGGLGRGGGWFRSFWELSRLYTRPKSPKFSRLRRFLDHLDAIYRG